MAITFAAVFRRPRGLPQPPHKVAILCRAVSDAFDDANIPLCAIAQCL